MIYRPEDGKFSGRVCGLSARAGLLVWSILIGTGDKGYPGIEDVSPQSFSMLGLFSLKLLTVDQTIPELSKIDIIPDTLFAQIP